MDTPWQESRKNWSGIHGLARPRSRGSGEAGGAGKAGKRLEQGQRGKGALGRHREMLWIEGCVPRWRGAGIAVQGL